MERPSPLTGLARSWIASLGFVFVFLREIAEGGLESIREMSGFLVFFGIATGAIMVLSLLSGFISWRTTRFISDRTELRVERNFLSKTSTRISYPKIQSVDISRPLIARLLGLSALSIDAGTESTKLEYLTVRRADALRDQILANMRSLSGHAPQIQTDDDGAEPETASPREPGRLIVAVKMRTLLLGVFLSNVLTITVPMLLGFLVLFGFDLVPTGTAVPILIGIAGFLGREAIGNANFRLEQVSGGLRISRGMFTLTTRSLKADRIQAVSIQQSFLQRRAGLYRVTVTVLGAGLLESDSDTNSIVLPYGNWQQVLAVLDGFWPGINIQSIPLTGQPERARWLTPLSFERHQWGFDDQASISYRGWLDHHITIVPHRRMQSIGLSQGPLQRKLRLATINIHITDGPITMLINHMAAEQARAYLDQQVERARQARELPGEPSYLATFDPPAADERVEEWPAPVVTPPPPDGWSR